MADGLDLVVHSFDRAVGQPKAGPGQDSIEVGSQQSHEFLEWLQPRAHRGTHPFLQKGFGSCRLFVFPE
jgi:hypothetical protein